MKYFNFYVIIIKRLFPTYVKVSISGTSHIKDFYVMTSWFFHQLKKVGAPLPPGSDATAGHRYLLSKEKTWENNSQLVVTSYNLFLPIRLDYYLKVFI